MQFQVCIGKPTLTLVLTHPSHHWNTGHLLSTHTDSQHSRLCPVPPVQVPWSAGGGLQRGPVCGGDRWVYQWCSTAEDALYQGMFLGDFKVRACACVCVCVCVHVCVCIYTFLCLCTWTCCVSAVLTSTYSTNRNMIIYVHITVHTRLYTLPGLCATNCI